MTSGGAPIVAVIDSGINDRHPHIGEGTVIGGIAFNPDGSTHEDWLDRLGHGTAVAAAIHEKAPQARLLAVRVFERALATNVGFLVRAIDWAIEQQAAVINLSLGTPNEAHRAALEAALGRVVDAGAVLVSPLEFQGLPAYPGALAGSVGVALDWDCPRDQVRTRFLADGRPVLAASGYPRPLPGVPVARNLSGISFAAANASGAITRLLEDRGPLGEPVDLYQALT